MLKKSKKLQAIVLVVLILLTTSVSCAATQTQDMQTMPQMEKNAESSYSDIRNSWAYEAISYVLDKGLIDATSETTFSPDQAMSRTALETTLSRMSGDEASDVAETADSSDSLTREDMALLLYEYIDSIGLLKTDIAADGNAASGDVSSAAFTDASTIGGNALTAVNTVTSLGLMSGKSDGSFAPEGTTTRAEAATVIYRLCMLIDKANTSDSFLAELSEKVDSIEQYTDYKTDEYQTVTLKGSSVSFSGTGATADGNSITITKAGTYVISGTLKDGRIIIDSGDDDNVRLVLNNAQITCSDGSPVLVRSAKNAIISLPAGTENTLTDGTADSGDERENGTLFSADDLWINGSGTLKISAKYKDGISSNDDIKITQAKIIIDAADDGITANDSVFLNDADVAIESAGDGIKATNGDEVQKGYITVKGGSLDVTSGAEGLQAETLLYIQDGSFTVDTTGADLEDNGDSAKGLKADSGIVIEDGSFQIDSIDDALHSDGIIRVEGGTYKILTGDDGLHADASVSVSGGTIEITKCYEGIESRIIDLSGGTINLTAEDDGINVAGGNDNFMGGGRPGTTSSSAAGYKLTISGGDIKVNSSGDGIDVNGSAYMTGGNVLINGPTSNGNGALDYDGVFEISGGTLLSAGSSGMAMAPSSGSTQYTIANTTGEQSAGTAVKLVDSSGKTIASFTPEKAYSHVVISSPVIEKGGVYTLYAGNTEIETFTITDIVSGDTANGGGMPGGGRGAGGGPGGGGGTPPDGGAFPGGEAPGSLPDRSSQQ